jgi:hypothetical protein
MHTSCPVGRTSRKMALFRCQGCHQPLEFSGSVESFAQSQLAKDSVHVGAASVMGGGNVRLDESFVVLPAAAWGRRPGATPLSLQKMGLVGSVYVCARLYIRDTYLFSEHPQGFCKLDVFSLHSPQEGTTALVLSYNQYDSMFLFVLFLFSLP